MNSFTQSNPLVARFFAGLATFALLLSLVPMPAAAMVAGPECEPGFVLTGEDTCVPDIPTDPCEEGEVFIPETEACITPVEPDTLTIDGYKYNDANGDGVLAVDEKAGIPDWTFNLYKGDSVIKTDTTDGSGYYSFTITLEEGQSPSDFEVKEVLQTGWTMTGTIVYPSFPATSFVKCIFPYESESIDARLEVPAPNPQDFEMSCDFLNYQTPVPPTPVLGCTDKTARNYNPDATANNASANDCDYSSNALCISPNLLVNASFEEPVVDGQWSIFNAVTGWAIGLSDGLEIWKNFDGYDAGTASNGIQNAELDGNASTKIAQSTTTIPGATYKLSFDFSPRKSRDLADNQMKVAVEGATFMTVADDGTTNTGNVWTSHAKTFVATDASTEFSFEEIGSNTSYGTLLDNVSLCLVSEPVIDVCPNVKGVQTSTEECTPTEVEVCEVTVVSDTTNTVEERADAFAKLITYPWSALISGASWIWADETVQDPQNEENYTFEKTFTWNGPISSSVIDIAADNSYEVFLNGVSVGSSTQENNHALGTQDQYVGFTPVNGENTLSIKVKNWAQPGGNAGTNPGGLLYKMTVKGNETVDCKTIPDGGGDGDNNDGDNNDEDDGSGTRTDRSRNARVLGESTSAEPLVLGEQVSAVPLGAADAGAGGASPVAVEFHTMAAVALLQRSRKNV